MAQVVSYQHFTMEAWVHSHWSSCWICGIHMALGQVFVFDYASFPLSLFYQCHILIFHSCAISVIWFCQLTALLNKTHYKNIALYVPFLLWSKFQVRNLHHTCTCTHPHACVHVRTCTLSFCFSPSLPPAQNRLLVFSCVAGIFLPK